MPLVMLLSFLQFLHTSGGHIAELEAKKEIVRKIRQSPVTKAEKATQMKSLLTDKTTMKDVEYLLGFPDIRSFSGPIPGGYFCYEYIEYRITLSFDSNGRIVLR